VKPSIGRIVHHSLRQSDIDDIYILSRRSKVKKLVLPLIEQAAVKGLMDNGARREWVVAQLAAQGLSDSSARLLTEAGVKLWKKLEAKRQKKAAKKAVTT